MSDYCVVPPFAAQAVPPLVMLVMAKDNKLFYKAYTDVVDLNDDGVIDATYTDAVNYYGYFDSNKCYSYDAGSNRFNPSSQGSGTNNHWCNNAWSGNFLNWSTMARIDILRKVLYGGKRIAENSGNTVLGRTRIPRDAHAWAKGYIGNAGNGLVSQLTPYSYDAITLCNADKVGNDANGSIVMVKEGYYPYAASTNSQQCLYTSEGGGSLSDAASGAYTERYVNVAVCVTGMLESNCLTYVQGASTPVYRPIGLMEKYGVNRHGTPDTSDDTAQMYFGLITGTYDKNKSGGVLRSNIWDIYSEVDSVSGNVKASSKIIKNLDKLEIVKYNYGTGFYQDCGLAATFTEGNCENWGNPIGEMYYEALRYFMGKMTPTTTFDIAETFLNLTRETQWCNPYVGGNPASCVTYPYCSKPFVLMLSDIYPSFDSDQFPGAYSNGSNWTSTTPNPNDTGLNVQTLITNSQINTIEGIGNVIIGQSGSTYDKTCSAKAGDFRSIRGLCVQEPTKEGSYYIAGLSHWGHTAGFENPSGKQHKVNTYVVATPGGIPELEFTVGDHKVQIVPSFYDDNIDSRGQLVDFRVLKAPGVSCPTADADCTNETANYGYTYVYDIMWDDSGQGNDYDLDIRYRIYIKMDGGTITVKTKGVFASAGHRDYAGYIITGVDGSGEYLELYCGNGTTDCGRACGRVNTGTGNVDVNTTCNTACYVNEGTGQTICPATQTNPVAGAPSMNDSDIVRTFNVTGSGAAFLKNPLYYAAKYGGFDDIDGNNVPNDASEWLDSSRGLPKTYFYASNPTKLESELEHAFLEILRRASSGTAASVLASGEGSGANLIQALFYPVRSFGKTEIEWTGTLQNFWYYIDPFLKGSTIREDTLDDRYLNIKDDYILHFFSQDNQTKVALFADANGDGVADSSIPTVIKDIDSMNYLWEAGRMLHDAPPSERTIYTSTDGSARIPFLPPASADLKDLLMAPSPAAADRLISYIRGTDYNNKFCSSTVTTICTSTTDCPAGETCITYRNRTVTSDGITDTWKLGDIVNSTPRLISWVPLNEYHLRYKDNTYAEFLKLPVYKNRGMVFVGANDGMLHAFRLGTLTLFNNRYKKAELTGTDLGKEEWAFIPRQALPYLTHMADPNYCHIYYVDGTPYIFDASIAGGPDAVKTKNTWRTILVGSMRLGGACKNACTNDITGDGLTDQKDCVLTPAAGKGYSSYFALDITNPLDPQVLWEFSDEKLGLSTSGPSVVRIAARTGGNPDNTKNGHWFVVFASGPTGPIETTTHQFMGTSDQEMKLFAIRLKDTPGLDSADITTIPSGIPYSFAGSFVNGTIDFDQNDASREGFYQDDAIYFGYVKAETNPPVPTTKWNVGGVLRLLTKQDPEPSLWTISYVVNGIGPVTSAVAKLQDYNKKKVWLYFGTGRYFYKINNAIDDGDTVQAQYGVVEPCYGNGATPVRDDIDPTCTTFRTFGDFDNATAAGSANENKKGWCISLDGCTDALGATVACNDPTMQYKTERVVTDTLATPIGAVFFTTTKPSADICVYGGSTHLWGVSYDKGGAVKKGVMRGQALIQVSTGSIEEKELSTAFTEKPDGTGPGRRTSIIQGVPPAGSPPGIIVPPKPINRAVHIKER